VAINGSPTTTQCYTYGFLTRAEYDLAEIAGAQVRGMPVLIYDPNGMLPSVTIMPSDDAVAVMKANNVPIDAPDGGLGYDYVRNYNAEFPNAAHGIESLSQVTTDAIQQTLAEGWTTAQMLTAGFTAQQLADTSSAPTGSLP
jgi:hypothetical protein